MRSEKTTMKSLGDSAALREALEEIEKILNSWYCPDNSTAAKVVALRNKCRTALATPPHTGKWENGREYEYEYAYCSACGHMQWADWDSHMQAEEHIEDFAEVYRFCPSCGAKMEGGVYVK